MATIKDIARIANVSPSTVSFVLNGKAREMKVSPVTEQRILEIVAATGYRPSNVARRLRASAAERPVLALYWPLDRRASYVGRLLGAFQQEHMRQELDYDLVVNTFREGHLCEEKGLHFHSPYSCAILGGLSPADMDALAQLETDLPLVLYNRRQAGFGAVYTDYAKAVRQVMELARAKGCRSIGFLKNRSNFMADSSRIRDAITAAGEYGLRVPPHAVVEAEDTYEGGAVGIKTMMTGGSLPELLVFASDIMAIGAAHQMQKEGIRIPQEVGIICFGLGERQQAQYCTPPLSVIEMPTEAMTAGAVQMAAEMIRKGANAAVVRSYEPVVIFRESFSL